MLGFGLLEILAITEVAATLAEAETLVVRNDKFDSCFVAR